MWTQYYQAIAEEMIRERKQVGSMERRQLYALTALHAAISAGSTLAPEVLARNAVAQADALLEKVG